MKNITMTLILALLAVFNIHAQNVPELSWPRDIELSDATATLYQPQIEGLNGNILEGRMALSFHKNDEDLVFGALWFKARILSDKSTRTVELEELDIPRVSFPSVEDVSQETIDKYKQELIDKIEGANVEMSLDMLISTLDENNNKNLSSANVKNDVPIVFYRKEPTILISIDGDPVEEDNADFGVSYVKNTPFLIVRQSKKKTYYLRGGDNWYKSSSITTGWEQTNKVPGSIGDFYDAVKSQSDENEVDDEAEESDIIPKILVSTGASELIITDGDAEFAPVDSTSLLYVSNTESDIIMDTNTQLYYILLSGRWYTASKLDDETWTFKEPGKLPDDFSKIPIASDIADVRQSVPGTDEAKDALLSQTVPQTAKVDRNSKVDLGVTYDGDPEFDKIDGTNLYYAKNTSSSVLKERNTYYCVDNAIWYVSNTPNGPWAVSDKRPEDVDKIPLDYKINNVKYVYIYDSSPDVVYVGYLPGYNYSYIYDGVVVYGPGYYYNPWYGPHYYPSPVTFGFGIHYNPWTGWGISFGFTWGWMGWSCHPFYHGYWGPAGYGVGYRSGFYRGYHHGYRQGYARGYVRGAHHNNMYRNRPGVTTHNNINVNINNNNVNIANKRTNVATKVSKRQNNVAVDREGNVFKQERNGEIRNVAKQSNKQNMGDRVQNINSNKTRQVQQTRQTQNARSSVSQSFNNRSRGASNYNNFRSTAGARMPATRGANVGGRLRR